MQPVFKLSLSPPGPVCFGLRLRPLTLGHAFLLAKNNLDFLTPETSRAGFVAVFICSQDWKESEKDLQKWWLKWFCRCWGWKCRRMNLKDEAARFQTYYFDSMRQLTIKLKSAGRVMASPWFVRVKALLMAEFHMSRDEAMDTPMLEATSLIYSLHETKGNVELWSDEDDEFWQWAKEQDEARAAQRRN